MNILFVDQFSELGGAQQCLLDLMPALPDRGWRAFAATPPGELAERFQEAGIPVELTAPGNYRSGSKSAGDAFRYMRAMLQMGAQLAASIRRNRIDLLYVNGPRLLPAACLAGNVPVLFHAHNFLPPGASRRIALAAIRTCRARAIAVSKYVAGYLEGAVPDDRLAIIRNGVADAKRDRRLGDAPHVGIIGRIAPEKGQLDFVEAARLLPSDWKFVICGSAVLAHPAYADRVRARAEGLPIEFLGWRNDVAEVLASLDLLVVPSSEDEALGRVVLEAFSAEVPVVAYRSGGIPELIEDGRTGYLIDRGDPVALADRIRTVMQDNAGRQTVTGNARNLWEREFTLELYRERITRVIANAAKTARVPAAANTGV